KELLEQLQLALSAAGKCLLESLIAWKFLAFLSSDRRSVSAGPGVPGDELSSYPKEDMNSEFEFINQEVGEGDLAEMDRMESIAANTLKRRRRDEPHSAKKCKPEVDVHTLAAVGGQPIQRQPLPAQIKAAMKPADNAVTPSSSGSVRGVVTGEAGSFSCSNRAGRQSRAATPRVGTSAVISERVHEFISESTWWMVDLDAPVKQGATPLVKRCMRVHGWDAPKSRRVLTAYRQFLTLKKEHGDWDATVLSPCYLVDQMWHQHILDVVNYCHDMMMLCGRVIGHNPDGAMAGKVERDEATKKALEQRFPDYDRDIWGYEMLITIKVKDQMGEETMFKVNRKTTKMSKIFGAYAARYAARKGCFPESLRFYVDGDTIQPDLTPAQLELNDGDQIDVILAQCGC
ncbi:hypothetical protein THAOC_28042, partial [Thalassiosira oceanica]